MKKLQMFFAIGFLLIFSIVTSALAQSKIAYVDSRVIISKLKDVKDAQEKLNELYKAWEQEAKNMGLELQKKQEDLEAQSLMLTDKAKAERAQELQALALQLRQFEQEKLGPQGEYFKEESKLMEPIQKKIQEAINKIGEAEGYDYIFDAANGNIVFAGKSQTNLTDRIVEELEKQSAATTTSANKTN